MLAKTFKISVQDVSQALLFRGNSEQSRKIREAVLINGGKLVHIIDMSDGLERMIKVLDSKGNVKAVITNDTLK